MRIIQLETNTILRLELSKKECFKVLSGGQVCFGNSEYSDKIQIEIMIEEDK